MSVWELEIKHSQDYRGLKNIYMVTNIDPKDKKAKEDLAREYNNSADFHNFRKTIQSAKCIATIDPDSAARMKGVYLIGELKRKINSFKEGCEIEAERAERQSHNLDGLVSLLNQK